MNDLVLIKEIDYIFVGIDVIGLVGMICEIFGDGMGGMGYGFGN